MAHAQRELVLMQGRFHDIETAVTPGAGKSLDKVTSLIHQGNPCVKIPTGMGQFRTDFSDQCLRVCLPYDELMDVMHGQQNISKVFRTIPLCGNIMFSFLQFPNPSLQFFIGGFLRHITYPFNVQMRFVMEKKASHCDKFKDFAQILGCQNSQ
jgi:hypothetical protein